MVAARVVVDCLRKWRREVDGSLDGVMGRSFPVRVRVAEMREEYTRRHGGATEGGRGQEKRGLRGAECEFAFVAFVARLERKWCSEQEMRMHGEGAEL